MAGKTRAPHKDGCTCVVCKAMRARMEAIKSLNVGMMAPPLVIGRMAPPPPIPEVRLDSLPVTTRFEYKGQKCQVNEKIEGMVVCYNLLFNETSTLGGSTMVKPLE